MIPHRAVSTDSHALRSIGAEFSLATVNSTPECGGPDQFACHFFCVAIFTWIHAAIDKWRFHNVKIFCESPFL
jgi:hypothetical protein